MRNTIDIAGVPVDRITMREAVEKVRKFLSEDGAKAIYTPNAEIMMSAHRDASLKRILAQADMLLADGAGVVLASRILGLDLPEKVSGYDLVKNVLSTGAEGRIRLFLYGGKPGVAQTAGKNIEDEYPGIEIAGYSHGYLTAEEGKSLIPRINSSGADMLLVALGAPRQEQWIHAHRNELNVRVCVGVGGSLDVFAGNVRLAPGFFRRHGLEWLYRLCKEPWRYRRMLDLPRFMLFILSERLKGGRRSQK